MTINGWHEAWDDQQHEQPVVRGHTGCCESSERQHGKAHFLDTGHPVVANQSGGDPWGYWNTDQFVLLPD